MTLPGRPAPPAATAGDGGDDGEWEVRLPSGAPFKVLNEQEADYLADAAERYQSQYQFTDVSDSRDLDKVVTYELLIQRAMQWSSLAEDYEGRPVDSDRLGKQITEWMRELRLLKKHMGIDKVTRDRESGEGSVADRWNKLLIRAKAFGYHRNAQAAKAIELINELIGLIQYHLNCSPEERVEFHVTAEDIVDWIWEIGRPDYEALDVAFRQEQQRMWIREM